MELTPASVTVLSYFDDRASMRMYNALPPGSDVFSGTAARW
jgi:probable phosphoglycerate mutase